jgi:hypothetical protein
MSCSPSTIRWEQLKPVSFAHADDGSKILTPEEINMAYGKTEAAFEAIKPRAIIYLLKDMLGKLGLSAIKASKKRNEKFWILNLAELQHQLRLIYVIFPEERLTSLRDQFPAGNEWKELLDYNTLGDAVKEIIREGLEDDDRELHDQQQQDQRFADREARMEEIGEE